MQSYANRTYVIDIQNPKVAEKLGLTQEWNDFISAAKEENVDFESFINSDDYEFPKTERSYNSFVLAFGNKYDCDPSLLYIDSDCEGLNNLEQGKVYLSIEEKDLFIRTPTEQMKKFQEVEVVPQVEYWTTFG